ncbi:PREDICTED: acyl-CoA-binding domain-containing protein 5-like [Rhagoletis zephyria]|uniref:acyl-CoA-binding domain-containing protein 5-like n=1 Tax=Rhagoletis zephyria TaxID=28612 RepID=UPI0008112D7F|nr:PREDICTED: acyl-CoA-binding domain-containing protein 5-like [Rhagoletis zephyria]
MSIEEQFNAAVKVIRSLPKNGSFQPSDELKLTFYAFFKQATEGPNTTKKPPFYDIVNRYKWDAWKKVGEISRQEAMVLYVEELKKVIETLSMNAEVSDFLDILGPFYEFLPEEVTRSKSNSNSSSSISSPSKRADAFQESLDDQVTTSMQAQFCTYDSEGDEFADTVDFTSPKSDKIPVILQNGSISKQFSTTANNCKTNEVATATATNLNGLKSVESKGGSASRKVANGPSVQTTLASSHSNCAISYGNSGSATDHSLGFNEQLTMAVFKLQHSLDRVVNRIDALESVLTLQSSCKLLITVPETGVHDDVQEP